MKDQRNSPNPGGKQRIPLHYWMILFGILFGLMIYNQYAKPGEELVKLSYSEFLTQAEQGNIAEVIFQGEEISGKLKDGKRFESHGPYNVDLVKDLKRWDIKVTIAAPSSWFMSLLAWLPFIFIFWWLMRRQGAGGLGGGIFGFGKSRPRVSLNDQRVTFQDVAGIDEAKEELQEVVEFLKDASKFNKLGAKIPKGVLLMGPPGTGKTLLGRAVAGEAGVPFLTISGSDFVEMFVGVGAARVRDLFEKAKKAAPCIIFIDEIDAVGRHRGAGLGGGHDEKEQTLNQLFVEMDGFEANAGIIVMAATNRPDVLDPALLRAGRFDRHVVVGLPDIKGREAILKIHTRGKILALSVDLQVISRGTPGFSGADLANLVNEAALLAGRLKKNAIEMIDFQKAQDRVMMGIEKKGLVMNEREREIVVYHEAGHVIAAKMTPGSDPVHKVTIIPRGRALGVTMQLPLEDRYLMKKSYSLGQLVILMGGRAAEMVKFEEPSSGAQNDIQVATTLAQTMICRWGMSEHLGPVALGKESEDIFLGRQIIQSRGYSDETARQIDEEVQMLLEDGLKQAKKIIEGNKEKFEALVKALLKKETLEEEEINQILAD